MSDRKQTQVTVIDIDGDYLPERVIDAIHWLADKLEKVPEEYREVAKIEVAVLGGDDDYAARVRVSYPRPETDGGTAWRLAREHEAQERQTAQELATLKALRQKYGDAA